MGATASGFASMSCWSRRGATRRRSRSLGRWGSSAKLSFASTTQSDPSGSRSSEQICTRSKPLTGRSGLSDFRRIQTKSPVRRRRSARFPTGAKQDGISGSWNPTNSRKKMTRSGSDRGITPPQGGGGMNLRKHATKMTVCQYKNPFSKTHLSERVFCLSDYVALPPPPRFSTISFDTFEGTGS